MKKILTSIVLIILMFGTVVSSEELPSPGGNTVLNPEKNPVYYGYLNDYATRLKGAFEKSKYHRNHQGVSYDYIVLKDGTITDMKLGLYENKRMNALVKRIILDNPPPPFYEGMDIEKMQYHVFLGLEDYEEYDIRYFPRDKRFWIDIMILHDKSNYKKDEAGD